MSAADYISTTEAADIIGVNDSRVRQLLRAGELSGKRFGRDWLILRRDAERFQRSPRGPVPGSRHKSNNRMR